MKTRFLTQQFRIVLTLLICQVPVICFSQGNSLNLIKDVKMESLNLSKHELKKVHDLSIDPIVSHVYALKIGALSKTVKFDEGIIPIKLPGNNNALVASTVKLEYFSDNNYHWSGQFKKDGGDISLVCKDGKYAGRITTNHKIYEIRSFSKENHFLVEYNLANFGGDIHKSRTGMEQIAKPNLKGFVTEDPVLIKILILYTDSCNIYYDHDMGPCIDLAMFNLQEALSESLSNPFVEVCLADSVETTYNEHHQGIDVDLDWLDSNSNVATLRDTKHADLVVLLTHGWKDERGTSWTGPDDTSAFAVVRAPYITSTFTFTHEVGHIFGCKHQIEGAHDSGYNHGYKFEEEDGTHSTIMHTVLPSEEYQRLNRFSNPDKMYIEMPMGTNQYNNNTLWIEQNAATVAAFKIDPTPNNLLAFIMGPSHGMPNVSYTWESDYNGGNSPYTCTWYKLNQYQWDPVETGWTYATTLPSTGSMIYLMIIVTSSDDQVAYEFYNIAIDQYEPLFDITNNHNQGQLATEVSNPFLLTDSNLSSKVMVYPIPLQETSVVQYSVQTTSKTEIKFIDLSGRTLLTFDGGYKEAGTYYQRLNPLRLNPGIYFCSVRIGETCTFKKIVIQ